MSRLPVRWFAGLLLAGVLGGTTAGSTLAAFSDVASNPGNLFHAASPTCVPGNLTLAAQADSWLKEDSPNQNNGPVKDLDVRPDANKRRRAVLRFPVSAIPSDCAVIGAVLRLRVTKHAAGHWIDVYRADGAWTESEVTWNNQPSAVGAPVSIESKLGWQSFTVTSIVAAQHAGTNDGLVVMDAADAAGGPNGVTTLKSREASSETPQLVVSYG